MAASIANRKPLDNLFTQLSIDNTRLPTLPIGGSIDCLRLQLQLKNITILQLLTAIVWTIDIPWSQIKMAMAPKSKINQEMNKPIHRFQLQQSCLHPS